MKAFRKNMCVYSYCPNIFVNTAIGISFAEPGKEIQLVSGVMPFARDFQVVGNAINLAARMAYAKRDDNAPTNSAWPSKKPKDNAVRICCDGVVKPGVSPERTVLLFCSYCIAICVAF